jgi:hypothetical protein
MYFLRTICPGTTGTSSTIKTSAASGSVAISKYGAAAVTSTQNGMKFFAGPRDDPFFFLGQFQAILEELLQHLKIQVWILLLVQMYLSVVVEVPKTMLGTASTLNVAETKKNNN